MFVAAIGIATLAISPVVAAHAGVPAWAFARPGTSGYIGDDGKDAATTTACPTVEGTERYLRDGNDTGCKQLSEGTPIVITGVIPKKNYAIVGFRAGGDARTYFSDLGSLKPAIPIGLSVLLRRAQGDIPLVLAVGQRDQDGGVDLGSSARARVLRFDPRAFDARDVEVTILSGTHAGAKGWIYARQALLADGLPASAFRLR